MDEEFAIQWNGIQGFEIFTIEGFWGMYYVKKGITVYCYWKIKDNTLLWYFNRCVCCGEMYSHP